MKVTKGNQLVDRKGSSSGRFLFSLVEMYRKIYSQQTVTFFHSNLFIESIIMLLGAHDINSIYINFFKIMQMYILILQQRFCKLNQVLFDN